MARSRSDEGSIERLKAHLPSRLHFDDTYRPVVERRDWRGYQLCSLRFERPGAIGKIILVHGVCSHAAQLAAILGGPLSRRGFETIALDLPGYGATGAPTGARTSYGDWIEALVDAVGDEYRRDARPIGLFGFSTGGMVAYAAACMRDDVAALAGTAFIDTRIRSNVQAISRFPLIAYMGPFQAMATAVAPAGKAPMWALVDFSTLINDPSANAAMEHDRRGAGAWVPNTFLSTLSRPTFPVEPEAFDACPLLHIQSGDDHFTPATLSDPFLARLQKISPKRVVIDGASHFPVEDGPLLRMEDACSQFFSETFEAA